MGMGMTGPMPSRRRHSSLLAGKVVLPRWMNARPNRTGAPDVAPPPPLLSTGRVRRPLYRLWWSWAVLGSAVVLLGVGMFIAMPTRPLHKASDASSEFKSQADAPGVATPGEDPPPATTTTSTSSPPTTTTPSTTGTRSTTATPSGSASSPSGQAMPTTAPAGYRQVVADDFTGSTLGGDWHPYSGQPGTDTGGWWDHSHVTVGGGLLTLHTYRDPAHYGQRTGTPWVEGGIDLWPTGVLTNGEYLVRSRVTSATGVTEVTLLWPNSGNWPPEIDFNESNGTNESTATFHWGTATDNFMSQAQVPNVNLTQWHTWGVIVTPTRISYTLDGTVWATTANHEQVPMALAIQQEVWPCASKYEFCPTSATPSEVDMQIDWAVVYAPLP